MFFSLRGRGDNSWRGPYVLCWLYCGSSMAQMRSETGV